MQVTASRNRLFMFLRLLLVYLVRRTACTFDPSQLIFARVCIYGMYVDIDIFGVFRHIHTYVDIPHSYGTYIPVLKEPQS